MRITLAPNYSFMSPDPSSTSIETTENVAVVNPRSPSWGAILAGAAAGFGAHFLLLMLFTALGLGMAQPATDENPVATFGVGSALVWTISALISLFVAGWVAGRCAARVHSVSGGMHGFLVWCVATFAFLLLVATGAGALVGGATRIVGQGLSAMGQSVAGVADVAKEAVAQNSSMITSFVDEVADTEDARNAPGGAVAARREIGLAVRQVFREGAELGDPAVREPLVRALTEGAGLSATEANARVDRWVASAERLRADVAELKATAAAEAREAAEASASALSHAALWSFIGFTIGAFAAAFGGRSGARWEYTHTEIAADASLDPAHRPPGRMQASARA